VARFLYSVGVRLFDEPGGRTVTLERTDASCAPGATNLWYRVVR
jgi:hypothetical protein